jgi:hypothetical protein
MASSQDVAGSSPPDSSSKAKPKKKVPETYGPSDTAIAAYAAVICNIEKLNVTDRGFVLNRLARVYFSAASAKEISIAVASKKLADKTSAKAKPFKKKWEATPEYQEWQAHIELFRNKPKAERESANAKYEVLRAAAFRVREELKRDPTVSVTSPEGSAPETGKESTGKIPKGKAQRKRRASPNSGPMEL